MFRRRSDSLGKILLACFVVAAVFAASLLSAAPQLHEELHRDAGLTSHLCAVTLFSSGHCQHATAAPIAAPFAHRPLLALLPASRVSLFVAASRSSILEHAPPVLA